MEYESVRDEIGTGDLVFFNGTGAFSTIIRATTGIPTHVAVVHRTSRTNPADPDRVQLMESTTLNRLSGKRGVQKTFLSERLAEYEGTIWLAKLATFVRADINWAKWQAYLDSVDGKGYDYFQAIGSGLGQLLPWLPSISLKKTMYCSELGGGALRESGAVPKSWDATPTPHQLAQWNIYSEIIRLKGPAAPFPEAVPRWTPPQIAANRV